MSMIKILNKILLIVLLVLAANSIEGGIVVYTDKIVNEISIQPVKKAINVFVTVYKYTKEQCLTADGSTIRPGVFWCAVSPDMLKKHDLSFGDTIVYKDVGYVIHDLTSERLKNTVDILIHDNDVFSESNLIYINKQSSVN